MSNVAIVLLIIVICMLIGALPIWPYSSGFGVVPGGVVFLVLILILVLAVTGRL